MFFFFFSSRRRHTRSLRDWSSDVCSSDLLVGNHPVRDVGNFPEKEMHGTDHDPRRSGHPDEAAVAAIAKWRHDSPNLAATSVASASTAGSASSPSARITTVDPYSAASI